MQHLIKIKIKKGGVIESLTEGIQGPSCQSETSWLDRLGIVERDEPTEDFYREEEVFEEVKE